ncbi:MAG TPA: RecX family transcriptional regulator, partial [Anaerolineae bacterium]
SKDRVSVYLDGKFAFGLALIHALWLRVGQALSDSEIDDLKAADTLEKAKQRAIGLISYRPRSVEEVKRRLKRVGVDDGAIEGVIASLRESGLLDDQSFSKAWVESRLGASPRSRRMIAWELRQKGVSEATISDSIENVDDEAAGLALATKHWPRFAKLETINERRRKMSEFLARHGFDYETIRDIITKLENKYGNNMGD